MKRGFYWIEIPGDGPMNGLSWAWRWITETDEETGRVRRLGIAVVRPGKALFVLWRETGPLNTMRVVVDEP